MSVRKHPTKKQDGWWIIDYYPDGRKGKRKRLVYHGTHEEAERQEMFIKSGLWEVNDEGVDISLSKLKFNHKNPPFIYFIRQGHNGPIKIGFTKADIYGRIKRLQTGNHLPLKVLAIIDGASKKQEVSLHSKFSAFKVYGEWFTPSKELLDHIYSITEKTIFDDLEELFKRFSKLTRKFTQGQKDIVIKAMNSESVKEFQDIIKHLRSEFVQQVTYADPE